MEIKLAKSAGFCFGVERAVELTEKTLDEGRKVFTWGPIVHNEFVTGDLESRGAGIFDPDQDIKMIPEGASVVLRAHGIRRETEKELREQNLNIVDATCPFVKKIHRIVEERSRKGDLIIITGNKDHPEVQGIMGWCDGPCIVIEETDSPCFSEIPADRTVTVVSQTTFQRDKFKKIVDKIKKINYNAYIADTVCNATRERQEEAARLAETSDVMIVIGSPNSSNSQKLYSICMEHCSHTYFIQSADDLNFSWFRDVKCVGITAGASTPKKILKEVQNHVGEF